MIDFHNHLFPGVDDGAADLDESRAALEAFRAQGVDTVVSTPHFRASLLERPAELAAALEALDAAWEQLRGLAEAEFPGMTLGRGVEVMLDTPSPDLSDPRLRLNGTEFVLTEFPYFAIPPNVATALFELRMGGWTPVVAHPERYAGLTDYAAVEEWKRMGAQLQVNCGSVVGSYGPDAQRHARALLARGLVDYLGSDYHARGRLHVRAAREALEARGAGEQAELLLEVNPRRLLAGEPPLPVPRIGEKRSFWSRLFGRR